MTEELRLMIDPPDGWLYGFPKEYTATKDEKLTDWLLANGYPEDKLKLAEFSRFWYVELQEEFEDEKEWYE